MSVSSSSSSDSSTSTPEEERRARRKRRQQKQKKYKKSSHKKSKVKHRRHKDSSSSSSTCSSDEEEQWVVKGEGSDSKKVSSKSTPKPIEEDNISTTAPRKPEVLGDNEEDWMNVIPTFSRDPKKSKKQVEKEERTQKTLEKPGQHARELNPYWKEGGTGLPSDLTEPQWQSSVGDGGLSWLKKSYQRAKEQAKEQNKSLEEIAEERWGSLNKFYEMLEKAEATARSNSGSGRGSRPEQESSRDRRSDRYRDQGDRDKTRGDDRDRDRRHDDNHRRRSEFKRPGGDSGSDNDDDRRRDDDRGRGPSSSHRRRPESDRNQPSWKKNTATSSARTNSETARAKISPPSVTTERLRRQSKDEDMDVDDVLVAPEKPKEEEEIKVLTDTEMNALSAKILKAELLGNTAAVEELKAALAEATKRRDDYVKNGPPVQPKVVTKIVMKSDTRSGGRRVTNKPTETHKDGQRVRYFPDDDRQTLKNMFEKEKMNTAEDENALFSRLAGRKGTKTTDEYDLDDEFTDKASSSKKVQKEKEQEVRNIVNEEKHYMKTLEDCQWCFDGNKLQKNIIISTGEKSFLCIPPFQSLTEGHCLIVPMYHVACSTQLDEDVWEEMQKFRRSVVKMFLENDEDTVIFETSIFLKGHPHLYWECVPMPKETGELAPIYFKKAIQECETEWAQNKKLVDLRGRDIRKAVPKGLPYFRVDFGFDSGFAHVIEDEKTFPKNFAQEIIGGMMELDHQTWRKHKRDDFKVQREKVIGFLKMWGPHDWTKSN